MMVYDPLAFGCALREHRHELGWSAIQLSELYANSWGGKISHPTRRLSTTSREA